MFFVSNDALQRFCRRGAVLLLLLLLILFLRVLESTLGKSVDQTGLTTLEPWLGLSTVSGTSLLTLMTTGCRVTLS